MNKRTVAIFFVLAVVSLLIGFYSFSSTGYTLAEMDEQEPSAPSAHKSESPYFPSDINFANEPMPVELYDVHEALERELIVNMNFHSSTIQYLKRSHRYFPVIEKILADNGIPDDFKYLSLIESDFMNKVSPKGASGFWQFMKDAAKDYDLEVNSEVDERYHLEKSTVAACKYLKNAYGQFGNWTMAAASYNMGAGGLSKQAKQQLNSRYYDLLLNEETMRYLYRIVAVKLILTNPESYGFHIPDNERYNPIQYTEEEVDKSVDDWAVFAKNHGTNYKYLKALNPWLRDTKLLNTAKKSYVVKIPKNE